MTTVLTFKPALAAARGPAFACQVLTSEFRVRDTPPVRKSPQTPAQPRLNGRKIEPEDHVTPRRATLCGLSG